MAAFSSNLAAGRASTLYGTGEQTQYCIHIEDAARANVLALEGVLPSGPYTTALASR